MDLAKIITELYAEKEKLNRAIAQLEEVGGSDTSATLTVRPGRRGRTTMGEIERLEVSKRMKRYWAGRRKRQA